MAFAGSAILILALCFTATTALAFVDPSGVVDVLLTSSSAKLTCQGSVAECMENGDEFALDSEFSRRILASKKYISYNAMKKNNVPCNRRGASYYNCGRGAQANPYKRGCSKITRCER